MSPYPQRTADDRQAIQYQPMSQLEVDDACRKHEFLMNGRMGGARANFSYKILKGLDLSGRNLADADLSGAILEGTNFSGANLTRATIFAADMRQANLSGAVLHRADMRGVILRGADLTGADLSQADLREGAIAQWIAKKVSPSSPMNSAPAKPVKRASRRKPVTDQDDRRVAQSSDFTTRF
ncbi:MAG: pentapeptide repeat-containing protein [Oceanicaulis sp.]|nr:pentapeptide repeat-containing protein [Oceanicaulis sp.]